MTGKGGLLSLELFILFLSKPETLGLFLPFFPPFLSLSSLNSLLGLSRSHFYPRHPNFSKLWSARARLRWPTAPACCHIAFASYGTPFPLPLTPTSSPLSCSVMVRFNCALCALLLKQKAQQKRIPGVDGVVCKVPYAHPFLELSHTYIWMMSSVQHRLATRRIRS